MTSGNSENSRLVYSSEGGPVERTKSAKKSPASSARRLDRPTDGVVRVSRSKAGRKGKTVTVITGLPSSQLRPLAKEMKRRCGVGGAVKEGAIELQGDQRDAVVKLLSDRYEVKLAGG